LWKYSICLEHKCSFFRAIF